MNSAKALTIIQSALEQAESMGINISIAVVDKGSNLLAFHRMDRAILGSGDVARTKAKTSVLFPMPTEDFGALCRNEKLDGMMATNGGLTGFGGGRPMIIEGQVVGAVGVSGGTAAEDAIIAASCIDAALSS